MYRSCDRSGNGDKRQRRSRACNAEKCNRHKREPLILKHDMQPVPEAIAPPATNMSDSQALVDAWPSDQVPSAASFQLVFLVWRSTSDQPQLAAGHARAPQ